MDRKLVLNAIDALDGVRDIIGEKLRDLQACDMEIKERRDELIAILDPPKIVDISQLRLDPWQFRR